MIIDAIVLAGGRSSRLGTASKAELLIDGSTLLAITTDAASWARAVVVVGPVDPARLPSGVLSAREVPAFGGPAAGIAAGDELLESMAGDPSDFTLVLACDMPRVGLAARAIADQLTSGDTGAGVIARDVTGRTQPLAAAYATVQLRAAVHSHRSAGDLTGLSVMALLAGLRLIPVDVPDGATDDIDTWQDAAAFGIPRPPEGEHHG